MQILCGRCIPVRLQLASRSGSPSLTGVLFRATQFSLHRRSYADFKNVPPESVPGKPNTVAIPTTMPTETPASVKVQPFHQRLGPLTVAFNAYGKSQSRSPLSTQFWSAIVIYLLADISAQTLSTGEDSDEWDVHRTARNLVIGGMVSIPGYKW